MNSIIETPNLIFKTFVILASTLVLGAFSYYLYYKPFVYTATREVDVAEVPQVKSVFSDQLKPIYAAPKTLEILDKKIKADLIALGVDAQGVLETPHDWKIGGWYKKSSKPGEKGNMVIDGHYDDNYGRPAAFWELKNVNTGDKVSVTDSLGKVYIYTVTDKFYVGINDPERLKVLESDDENKSTMTMITCGGVWLGYKSTYDKRLVVKAELINSL